MCVAWMSQRHQCAGVKVRADFHTVPWRGDMVEETVGPSALPSDNSSYTNLV